MTTESLAWQSDVLSMINEFGERLTFVRAGRTMLVTNGAFGKIYDRNVVPTDPSPIESEQRIVTIPVNPAYTPEILDVVQDSHSNFFQIIDITTSRYQDTDLCYILSIT